MKKILITGANSYIGTSFEKWLGKYPDRYFVDTVSTRDDAWKKKDFSEFDVVFHVAGIAHVSSDPKMAELYFKVNRDLTIDIAKKAKEVGVSQFVFMSTMAVYGEEGKIGQEVIITRNTPVNPKTFYGISKVEAEAALNRMNDDKFRVVILRPPMVYGPNCPGNYARLEKLAVKSPIFPMVKNERSMLKIDKLCQYVKEYVDNEVEGLFLPQDDEYVNTSLLVRELAKKNGKSIHLSRTAGLIIKVIGKRINLINKVFGNLVYEKLRR